MKAILLAALLSLVTLLSTGSEARADQPYDPSTYTSMAEPTDSIPIGTRITIQNWQNYQKFMSLGLRSLMSQKYFWKVPADAVLEVAPTVKIGLPRKYREDTQKYHNQTKLIQKGEGYTISGYVAGMPFPDIDRQDPLAGAKLIYDNYYNYIPYRVFSEAGPKNGAGWSSVDRYSNKTYSYVYEIYFKFKHISDPWGLAETLNGSSGGTAGGSETRSVSTP